MTRRDASRAKAVKSTRSRKQPSSQRPVTQSTKRVATTSSRPGTPTRKTTPKNSSAPSLSSAKPPEGQLWIRWVCKCCNKIGVFSAPRTGQLSGNFPFEITLGIHRTISRSCRIKDVTLRGSKEGILEVVLQRGKSKPDGE